MTEMTPCPGAGQPGKVLRHNRSKYVVYCSHCGRGFTRRGQAQAKLPLPGHYKEGAARRRA